MRLSDLDNIVGDVLTAALAYAALGIPTFPVQLYERLDAAYHTLPGQWNKVPLIKAWQLAASTDPRQLTEWFRPGSRWRRKLGELLALGMLTGPRSSINGVDADPRNGGTPDVVASLNLPPTLTVTTISGGTHHWFTWDGPVLRSGKLATGVDFKAHGGFVVIPPSYGYSFVDATVPLAPLPAHLAQSLLARGGVDGPVSTDLPEFEPIPDRSQDPYFWSFWCDAQDEEAVIGRRSTRVFWFMRRCRDLGLTYGQMRTALSAYPPALSKEHEKPGWLDADLLRYFFGGRF